MKRLSLGHKRHCSLLAHPLGSLTLEASLVISWEHSRSPLERPMWKNRGFLPTASKQTGFDSYVSKPSWKEIHQCMSRLQRMAISWDTEPEYSAELLLDSQLSAAVWNNCFKLLVLGNWLCSSSSLMHCQVWAMSLFRSACPSSPV